MFRTTIIVIALLSSQYTSSHCNDFASQFSDYTCLTEDSFYQNSEIEYFRVKGQDGDRVMRVSDLDNSAQEDSDAHRTLQGVEGILQFQESLEDTDGHHQIQIFEDCIDTLTLESTLLKHRDYFGDNETTILTFFVGLLKTIGEVHDKGKVLANLKLDGVVISANGKALIENLSGLVDNGSESETVNNFNEYSSPKEYEDNQSERHHVYTGWEDYFSVGVMMYYSIYGQFPFDPSQITKYRQYINTNVVYSQPIQLLSRSLLMSLLGRLSDSSQIDDIRRFADNFKGINKKYFNIPLSVKTSVGIGNFMTANLSNQFVDGEIEKVVGFEEFFGEKNQKDNGEEVLGTSGKVTDKQDIVDDNEAKDVGVNTEEKEDNEIVKETEDQKKQRAGGVNILEMWGLLVLGLGAWL